MKYSSKFMKYDYKKAIDKDSSFCDELKYGSPSNE